MEAAVQNNTVQVKRSGFLGKVKSALTVTTIIGLLSTNIATLTNDHVHAQAFTGLEALLQHIPLLANSTSLLSNSPTVTRKEDVAKRTGTLESEKKKLAQEKLILVAGNEALAQVNRKISADQDELNARHKTLVATHNDLSDRHTKLVGDHNDLRTRHSKLVGDHNDLNSRHSKLNADHAALGHTAKLRQDTVRQISSRMAPRIGGIAAKGVVSLPARAAPAVGTAVSIAFTAWELNELCSLVKDLQELNNSFGQPLDDPDKVCGIPKPTLSDIQKLVDSGNFQIPKF